MAIVIPREKTPLEKFGEGFNSSFAQALINKQNIEARENLADKQFQYQQQIAEIDKQNQLDLFLQKQASSSNSLAASLLEQDRLRDKNLNSLFTADDVSSIRNSGSTESINRRPLTPSEGISLGTSSGDLDTQMHLNAEAETRKRERAQKQMEILQKYKSQADLLSRGLTKDGDIQALELQELKNKGAQIKASAQKLTPEEKRFVGFLNLQVRENNLDTEVAKDPAINERLHQYFDVYKENNKLLQFQADKLTQGVISDYQSEFGLDPNKAVLKSGANQLQQTYPLVYREAYNKILREGGATSLPRPDEIQSGVDQVISTSLRGLLSKENLSGMNEKDKNVYINNVMRQVTDDGNRSNLVNLITAKYIKQPLIDDPNQIPNQYIEKYKGKISPAEMPAFVKGMQQRGKYGPKAIDFMKEVFLDKTAKANVINSKTIEGSTPEEVISIVDPKKGKAEAYVKSLFNNVKKIKKLPKEKQDLAIGKSLERFYEAYRTFNKGKVMFVDEKAELKYKEKLFKKWKPLFLNLDKKNIDPKDLLESE